MANKVSIAPLSELDPMTFTTASGAQKFVSPRGVLGADRHSASFAGTGVALNEAL
jgi:hypothetical protein